MEIIGQTTGSATSALRSADDYGVYMRALRTAQAPADATDEQKAAAETKQKDIENNWKAAKKVEAVFLGMLLSEMRKTVEKGDLFHGGAAEDMFQQQLDGEYVQSFEKGPGVGIARLYFEQLMRNSPAEAAKARGRIATGFVPLSMEKEVLPLNIIDETM